MEPSRSQRIALFLLRPKIAIPLAILGLLLSAPLVFRASRLSGLPDIPPPFDVEKYGTIPIEPADNAYEYYRKASALLPTTSGLNTEEYDKALDQGWSAASEDVRKWVTGNRAAVELWLKGTAAPDALFCQPRDQRIDTWLDAPQSLRRFARLAKLEGSRLEAEAQPEAAWNMYRAVYRSSRHCGRHGSIIERLIGKAIHGMAIDSINTWSANQDVDVSMLKRARQQISADYRLTSPASAALRSGYFELMNLHDDPRLASIIADDLAGVAEAPSAIALFVFNEREVGRRVTKHVFANWLAQVDKPRHARTAAYLGHLQLFELDPLLKVPSLTPSETDECFNRAILARMLMPALVQLDDFIGHEQARQACLTVILAAQAYQRDHGGFPEKLEDLRDNYLDELPADPFGAAGETIHYRRDGERAVVWSIFENGLDDGGDVQRPSGGAEPGDMGYEFAAPKTTMARPSAATKL